MSNLSLTTQCPACQQILVISPWQLAQARGRVVCGHCQQSFDALPRLALAEPTQAGPRSNHPRSNELPQLQPFRPGQSQPTPDEAEPASPAAAPVLEPEAEPASALEPASTAAAVDPTETPADRLPLALATSLPPSTQPSAPADADDAAPVLRQAADDPEAIALPVVAAPTRPPVAATPPRRRRHWLVIWVIVGLILLALAGWLLRGPLGRTAVTGPGVAWVCSWSGCQLPARRDRDHLQLVAREVRANPQAPGQLAVNLTLRNTAWFSQPYPTVTVTLLGAGGATLGAQTFQPADYLGPALKSGSTIQAGAELAISLQMPDPGVAARDFALQLQ